MNIGYALCDLNDMHRDISGASQRLPAPALEIQREGDAWNAKVLKGIVERYDFVSVHAPTRNVDLGAIDNRMIERSLTKTVGAMDLAHDLDADAFVMHPVHHEGWLEPRERNRRRFAFIEMFKKHIAPHYVNNSHRYDLAIENIEYSKYPATLEETSELVTTLNAIQPVGIALDIPHIWNTRRILAENEHLRNTVHGYPRTPKILYEYVEKFIDHNRDNILLYHLANFGEDPIRTHDAITPETIRPELRRLIPVIRDTPIILEVHGPDDKAFLRSRNTLEDIAHEPAER